MTGTLRTTSYLAPDGVRLAADRGGNPRDPAVILLHGGGQTRHSWSRVVARLLREGFQVINFDARGHGESDWSPAGAYALSDRASDLAAVTADLDVPFILVGASLGGATSIVAIDAGLRPAGLVLVDIVPEPEPKGVERVVAFMKGHVGGFSTIDEAAAAVAAYNPQRVRPIDGSGLMKNLRKRGDGRLHWHWDPRIIDVAPTAHNAVLRTASESLRSLEDLPVLLVRGLASDVVSDASVGAFQRQLERLEVLDVAGAGHMVAGDRNDAFSDGIVDFARKTIGLMQAARRFENGN
ncbi:alpha/beta fold hydrolase [Sphingopyxis sp.]|uniref:alpha/beta fold hydrolase n=1 Tax=Sphingopyxis sp. TaxID=1908224 RepID=UPI003BAA1849